MDSNKLNWYTNFINNRFLVIDETIKNFFGENFYKGKTLLELGALHGNFGNKFYERGAIVTCYEGRQSNLDIIKQLHPQFTAKLADMDSVKIEKHYDIILHTGLLYHMKNVKENLEDCLNNCDVLILETENIDEEDSKIIYVKEGYSAISEDSSLVNSDLTDYLSRTTRKYLENIFTSKGFQFHLVKDGRANTDPYIYDWPPNPSKTDALRSIYIVWKKQ